LQRILRSLFALVALIAATTALVACGGGDSGESASSDTDVNTLLDKTFNGSKDVKSGKIDLSLKAEVTGGDASGPIDVSLSGPFESQGAKKMPKFDMDLSASGQGQNIKAGVENTGDKAFVNFNGTDYVVSDEVYNQFKTGYEQAASKNANSKQTSLASLGLDPKKWLTNPKNEGEAKVGDTDVIKITGGLDVDAFLDDVNTALSKAGSLGVPNSQLPSQLTADQKQQLSKALKDVKVEIDTGADDSILRRMKIDVNAVNPDKASETATVAFDLQLLDLNEGQSFDEPSNAKPFEQLLQQFGGAGALGALGGSPNSSSGGGSSSGASQEKLKQYSDCLEQAGQDLTKAQKCADILNP